MMLRKSYFLGVDGFNVHYATHYQDIDACLKLREQGQRIIYAPTAVLIHHEFASRSNSYDHIDRALLLDQWQSVIEAGDPYYNRNFQRAEQIEEHSDYTLPRQT